jgi:hypothetical protein
VEPREVDIELDGLWNSVAHVWDLVLGGPIGTSSWAASLSLAAELIEDHADTMATDGVHWGPQSALSTTVSYFPELEFELELLVSGHNADLMEDRVDALWTRMHRASKSLVAFIPPSVAHGSPDDMGDE